LENKHQLKILNLAPSSLGANSFILLLASDRNPDLKFPIVIGQQEAQSISLHLEGIKPSRPLTHDLFIQLVGHAEIILNNIEITSFQDGIFYAKISCSLNNSDFLVDARPSDGIAISLRANIPIFISAKLLQSLSITSSETNELMDELDESDPLTEEIDVEELQGQLKKALLDEDYESAAQLRDLITRRIQDENK
jgi:bifunctional DNase/RNase